MIFLFFSDKNLWLGVQAPNLRFLLEKMTFTLGQDPSGNLQPFGAKNYPNRLIEIQISASDWVASEK